MSSLTNDRAKLLELAARIEAAEGRDYQLDHEIAVAIGIDMDGPNRIARFYTFSIDDALTLKPAGWIMRLGEVRFGLWNAEFWKGDQSFKSPATHSVLSVTPALALCAAALKARAKGIEAGTDQTAKQAEPAGRVPGPKGSPNV